MERRRQLSHGKAALPVAAERVRSGFREAEMPKDAAPSSASLPALLPSTSASVEAASVPVQVQEPAPRPAARAGEAARRPQGRPAADRAASAPSVSVPAIAVPTGRDAAMQRRAALSQGKAALNAGEERVRSGFREAALPAQAAGQAPAPMPAAPAKGTSARITTPEGGRAASLAHRKALSLGKAALPAANERVRSGFRQAAMPSDVPATSRQDMMSAAPSQDQAGQGGGSDMGRYAFKAPGARSSLSGGSVTGLSYSTGRAMTGAEAGHDKPLTGTNYVSGTDGGYRGGHRKVGHARTPGGQQVSGTMLRSGVRITGDEERSDLSITGNAEQRMGDDLNHRGDSIAPVGAQFGRQSQAHGHTVFGTSLGRAAKMIGARKDDASGFLEQTLGGHTISGSAIGRSGRVTGDESGASRSLTGSQYFASAEHQARQASAQAGRMDPASGTKVSRSQTWGGQAVTGPQMERHGRVTGIEAASSRTMTGTPYYGAVARQDADGTEREAGSGGKRPLRAITGNVPYNHPSVSGTHVGADRLITGSTYFINKSDLAGRDASADPLHQAVSGFSVSSPQRAAQMQARSDRGNAQPGTHEAAITGTFAQGEGKVTGNIAFGGLRRGVAPGAKPASRGLTGEGATKGYAMTGSAYTENGRVTGTEGYIATGRNPSTRSGSSHGFAGAKRFKSDAPRPEAKSNVTGTVGSTLPNRAHVTLSGGAAG